MGHFWVNYEVCVCVWGGGEWGREVRELLSTHKNPRERKWLAEQRD